MLPTPASMHRRVRVHPARPEMNCSPPKVLLARGGPRRAEKLAVLSLLSFSSVCQRLRKTAAAAPIHSPPRRRREHDNDSAIANVSKRAGRERGEVADGGCFACHPITIDDDYDGDELGNRERRREAHRHTDERAVDRQGHRNLVHYNQQREWSAL